MSKIIKIVFNPVIAALVEPDRDAKLLVNDLLSYKIETGPKGMGVAHGSMFDMIKCRFPTGFVRLVTKKLEAAGYRVMVVGKPAPEPAGPENPVVDEIPYEERYDYQWETMRRLVVMKRMIAQLATGCHAKGQLVLMYDGSLKPVELVEVGDVLMGPDSRPRNVIRLCRGRDQMYRISPLRGGKPFVVNGEHILSLERTSVPDNRPESIYNGEWVELTVNEYLSKDKTFRHLHKLHRSRGIDFCEPSPSFDPYILGALLGDGSIKEDTPAITTADQEVVEAMEGFAARVGGLKVVCSHKGRNGASTYRFSREVGTPQTNPVKSALESLSLWGCDSEDKFIPAEYKVAPERDRLELLAGLIDTDGYKHNGGYDFVSKSKQLAADFAFVARSLGFGVAEKIKTINSGTYAGNSYYRVSVYGETSRIPVRIARKKADPRRQKKDACLSGFTVEALGEDDYYGFQVDDDNLYLLDDFTVTHNSGKSRVFKLCSERINLPTLFVTTRKSLMYQMAEGYKTVKSGRPIGIIGDGCWNPQPNGVNFAIVDTLVSRLEVCTFEGEMDKAVSKHVEYLENQVQLALKKAKLPTTPGALRHADKATLELVKNIRSRVELANKFDEKAVADKIKRKVEKQQAAREETLEFLKCIGFLCLEEAHEVSGNGFFELCNSMPNAHYRLALTATPFMKDSEEANMRLMAATGTIGIKVSEKDLIDRGILAKPFFKIIPSKKPENVIRGTAWQAAYERGIMNNVGRNMQIVAEIAEARRYGLTAIILVQRTKHGEVLNKLLETVGVKVEFIQGENDQAARQAALNRLGRSEIDVLIGTSILDVGVDVPSVGMVILAGGGKAEVAQRQRIGRGLRAKKLGPNVCYIVDFDDLWNNHTAGHSRERRRIIESTPGFAENIVHYFDFSGHGLKKVA